MAAFGVRLACAAALLALAGACDDPLRPRPVTMLRQLRVLMILDPDSTSQHLTVRRTDESAVPVLGARVSGDELFEVRGVDSAPPDAASDPCRARYFVLEGIGRCLTFGFAPQLGATYHVEITEPDGSLAHATTTVPGSFAIVARQTEGAPPGSVRLRATWTKSAGAYRYAVAVRGRPMGDCVPDALCHDRWSLATADTTIDIRIDARHFEATQGPYRLDVYAMNRDVYDALGSVTDTDLFPITPARNVQGGYGLVGAWVIRSAALP